MGVHTEFIRGAIAEGELRAEDVRIRRRNPASVHHPLTQAARIKYEPQDEHGE